MMNLQTSARKMAHPFIHHHVKRAVCEHHFFMKDFMRKKYLLPSLVVLNFVGCGNNSPGIDSNAVPEGTTLKVALLETTDLHQNILSYDYYGLKADTSLGLERTASLISAARTENPRNAVWLE